MIISIDGGAATGKTATAKLLANKINFFHLNSGLLYRAITYIFLKNNYFNKDNKFYKTFLKDINLKMIGNKVIKIYYNDLDITEFLFNKDISKNIKFISNNIVIRNNITKIQRLISKRKNIVCEGRDIGSVVFPDAAYKFFLIADLETRVKRRYLQFLKNDIKINKNKIKKMIIDRDNNDIKRKNSPLKKMPDSILIDTSGLTIIEQVEVIYKKIKIG